MRPWEILRTYLGHKRGRPDAASVIAELKAGSEEAFASLIAQYHAPLYSLIARTIPDPCEAADITQDVFIKVYRGIGGFHGDSSLRTWIYRIALHVGLPPAPLVVPPQAQGDHH